LNVCRSRREGSHTSTTSAPRPPSPPSGPPRGTWASRRKDTTPSPPAPACTKILALSVNTRPIVRSGRPLRLGSHRRGPGRKRRPGARARHERDRYEVAQPEVLPKHQEADQRGHGRLHAHEDPEYVLGQAAKRFELEGVGDRRRKHRKRLT